MKYLYVGLLFIWSITVGFGAFPAGIPVTPYLIGQNDWYQTPDSAWPTIKNSGVAIVRIGGHTFDVTPLSDSLLLQQVDQIRGIGAEPLIQVSRFASLQTAINTLTYINLTNARHVKYWSIGNEPDLNYVGTDAQMAAEVAAYIKQIAPLLRDVDPGITIVAPDLASFSSTKFNELLGGGSDITGKDSNGRYYVDCVSFHRYGGTSFTTADALNDMHSGFESTRVVPLLNRIAYANSLQGRTGASALTWALTEFNITTSNPANNTPSGYGVSSFLNGQFFAEYYRVAMKQGVAVMNTWSLLEGGGNGSAGDLGYLGGSWSAPVPRSSYYHMQMIANYLLPGGYLDGMSSSPNVAVLGTSSSAQATLSVMLLNEDTFNHTFSLRLDNGMVLGSGDTRINVAANLASEYSGTIGQQSTVVLVFDATGGLLQRVTYSLALNSSNAAPVVEIFNAAAAPTFSPAPGIFANAQSVSISSATPAASIRYTTDGGTPTFATGTLYSGPVAISTGTTLKAVAYSTDFTESGVTTGAYTIGASIPAMPASPTATAASSIRINLSWSASAGATSYNVKRSAANGGPYTTIVAEIAATTFSDVGLTPNTTYYYVVSGINANGEGSDSSQTSAATFTPAVGTTAAFEAESLSRTVVGTSASVNPDVPAGGGNWVQLNSSAAGQYVEFTTGPVAAGAYDLQLIYKANNNRGQLNLTVDDGLVGSLDQYAAANAFTTATVGSVIFNSAGTHRIRLTVTGRNASGTGFLLSADRFLFLAQASQVAAAPTGVMAGNGDVRVVLNWTASPGAASHVVKRALTTGGPYTAIASGIVTPTYTDTALTNGTPYYYVISAINALGESPDSFEAFATPQAGTPSPSFEAELLAFTTVPVGAATAINTDALTSGGKWVQLSANGTAQSITFTTGSVSAGSYTMQLAYKSGNNRAQVSVAVDGVTVGGTIDQYNATNTYPTVTVGSVTFASTGTHTIRLMTTGRNAANTTGFAVSADKFTFTGRSAATLTLGNLNPIYDGTPKAVTTATTPSGLTVTVTYNGSSSVPTAAGSYPVLATINDPLFYSTVSSMLVIAPAPATVTLSNLAYVYDGVPKSVTATTNPAGLPVTFTYDGSSSLPTEARSYTVVGTVANPNYVGSATRTLVIAPAGASVVLGDLTQTYDGSPKPVSVITSPAGLSVTVTYDGFATTPINAGSYSVAATIADANYNGSITGALVIGKATPTLTWNAPAAITYSTALGAAQLNATANTAGVLIYTPAADTVLNAGAEQILSVAFTPADTGNFTAASAETTITVNKAAASIALDHLTATYDGTPKSATVTTAPVGLTILLRYDGLPAAITPLTGTLQSYAPAIGETLYVSATGALAGSVHGTNSGGYTIDSDLATAAVHAGVLTPGQSAVLQILILADAGAYTGSTENGITSLPAAAAGGSFQIVGIATKGYTLGPVDAGSYTVTAVVLDANYASTSTDTFVIAKATPMITWSAPAAISYGTAIGGSQLNASASTVGIFAYTPAAGTILNAGADQTLTVAFTPNDTTNFSGATASTSITVNKANAPIALNGLGLIYNGTPKSAAVTTTPAGLTVNITYDGSATPPINAGNYAVAAIIVDANYTGSATGALVIAKAPATITLGSLASTYDGTPKSATALTWPAGLSVTMTYNGSATPPTNAGSYAVAAAINHINYAGTASGTLVIAKSTTATIALAPLTQSYDGTAKTVTATTNPAGLTVNLTYNGVAAAPIYPGLYTVITTINDANYSVTRSDTLIITITALVRHAPSIYGIVEGSVQVLLPENFALNGYTAISGDILVPGTPTVQLNSNPIFAGTKNAPGSATPTNYTVTLNGGSVLSYLVRRINAIAMPTVVAPTAPVGIRNVTVNNHSDPIGSFATLRNLTLNSNAGAIVVPAGAYGTFVANGSSSFVLGTAGTTTPALYQLQGLTLNGASAVQIAGPVIIRLANGLTLNNGKCGTVDHPEWLDLEVYSGGVTLNTGSGIHGFVTAPASTVTINGNTTIHGGVSSDRLTINSNGLLGENEP